MSNEKVIIKQGLTGGTSSDLDSVSYAAMVTSNVAFVSDGVNSYYYEYDATSLAAERSPSVIAPADVGANPGRWLLRPSDSPHSGNLLLNPAYLVNQDVYTFGVAVGVANTYLLDGWFSDTVNGKITDNGDGTHTVVDLLQAIDRADLDGEQVTISATVTNAGTLDVYAGGVDSKSAIGTMNLVGTLDTLTPAASFNLTIGAETYPAIKITGTAEFHSLQLELGVKVTPNVGRSLPQELDLCQREFFKTYLPNVQPGSIASDGSLREYAWGSGTFTHWFKFILPVTMRATPTVTPYSSVTGASGKMRDLGASLDRTAISFQISPAFCQVTNSEARSGGGAGEVQMVANARI